MQQPPQGPFSPSGFSYPNAPQPSDPQWTQMPVPGQGMQPPVNQGAVQGQWSPGQLPPPAQIDLPPEFQPQPPAMYTQPQGAGYEMNPPLPQNGEQQPGYQPPKTGMPRAQAKSNKKLFLALAIIVVGFIAFAVLKFNSPGQVAYGQVHSGSLTAQYTGDAVIVRSETVFSHTSTSQVEYLAQEGAFVSRGDNVATAYASGFSAKEWNTLEKYRTRIKEYHKSLIENAAGDTRIISLMDGVVERTLEAQKLVQGAKGSLTAQEQLLEKSMDDLQLHIKQKYPDDQKLSHLYEEEDAQLQRISGWSKQYAAQSDGLISFYTDGFENVLNMFTYATYTPSQVRNMYNGKIPETETTYARTTVPIYRLVKQEPWLVLMLCNEMDWTPVENRSYKLLIESFDNTVVDATVESFTRSGGELLIRLRIHDTTALENVLYIRSCQVQLGESVNSLTVPSRAIFVQDGKKGVVMRTDGGDYWTGVEVVSDDGSVAYVIPENPGVLYDGLQVRLF
ncbi:MAG: hypothetical protein E7324_03540 [Clostridiales bacterium]|nr:hypothetical protein [Clostridiales bacterium]